MSRREWIPFYLAVCLLAVSLPPGGVRAAIISEDFSYASSPLMNLSGGSGFNGAWGASTGASQLTSRVRAVSGSDLSYSGGGYNITQAGSGYAFCDYNQFRGINRYTASDLTGDVWFSALLQVASSSDHIGVQFNNHARPTYTGSDYAAGPYMIELSGTNLNVFYNSTSVSTIAVTDATLSQTHLLLGKWTVDNTAGANDRLQVWLDPADLTSLGTPVFDAATANLGDNLYLVGIFGSGSSNVSANTINKGFVDAIRVADGTDAFNSVTGIPVPEPAGLLVLLPALLLLRRC